METLPLLVFAVGVLLLVGIASSKFSARIGMPVLVLFLGVGMLAGSDGLGIAFSDYGLANSIGSIALALILFDGGLQTSMSAVRATWKPALVLSTVGVLITSVVTGAAAAWALDVPLLHGMLLGSIVGSTDAAAVFSVMRTSGIALDERLTATLEVESGSNDPMAIFLTVGLISVLTGTADSAAELGSLLALQMGVGTVGGLGVGFAAAWAVNRVGLTHAGLYPILALAFGLVSFGLTAVLGGSGFLAVYITGILLSHRARVFRRGILSFHDAGAWLSQIILFVMLGLLSFPSRLLDVAPEGLLVAAVLILVARPLAVVVSAWPFRFKPRELVFLSWVGLKGAVPITLATFPLTAGIAGSETLFNVVFFVVLVSAVTQGGSLPMVARALKLGQPAPPPPPISLEVNALRRVDGDIVDYTVAPSARVAGQLLRALPLPDGSAVTLVVRDGAVIVPRGATALRPGDHVFVALHLRLKPLVDRLFDPDAETPPLAPGLSVAFPETATVGQLHRLFGIPGPTWSEEPVRTRLVDRARLGPFRLSPGAEPGWIVFDYDPAGEVVEAEPHAADAPPTDA